MVAEQSIWQKTTPGRNAGGRLQMRRLIIKIAVSLLAVVITFLLSGWKMRNVWCRQPLPWHRQQCKEMEKTILEATVRIQLHGWVEIENGYEVEWIMGTISHATVIDGRYLITHNHFGIPLSQAALYSRHGNGEFTGVSAYRLDGTAMLKQVPWNSFVIVAEQEETTVLDFGQGFFTNLGLRSVKVAEGTTVQLKPGMEVAQIDWDGQGITQVFWTEVEEIYAQGNSYAMRVPHFIELGASGGGVFVNGVHIGNNWRRITRRVQKPHLEDLVRRFG